MLRRTKLSKIEVVAPEEEVVSPHLFYAPPNFNHQPPLVVPLHFWLSLYLAGV